MGLGYKEIRGTIRENTIRIRINNTIPSIHTRNTQRAVEDLIHLHLHLSSLLEELLCWHAVVSAPYLPSFSLLSFSYIISSNVNSFTSVSQRLSLPFSPPRQRRAYVHYSWNNTTPRHIIYTSDKNAISIIFPIFFFPITPYITVVLYGVSMRSFVHSIRIWRSNGMTNINDDPNPMRVEKCSSGHPICKCTTTPQKCEYIHTYTQLSPRSTPRKINQ